MNALAIALAGAFYVAGGLLMARWQYGRTRPSRAPLCGPGGDERKHLPTSCDLDSKMWRHDHDGHSWRCYTRKIYPDRTKYGLYNCEEDAVISAALFGFGWPLRLAYLLLATGIVAAVFHGHKPLPAEVQAAIRELETERDD
jgi:uncharacterized membrane protein YedE/YeeE